MPIKKVIPRDDDETLFADGFDDAIIGIDLVSNPARVIYDKVKMIEILVTQEEMEEDEAIDFLAYNVWGAYVGEGTPIYMDDGDSDYIRDLLNEL
jgi:hypothetical protein